MKRVFAFSLGLFVFSAVAAFGQAENIQKVSLSQSEIEAEMRKIRGY